MSREHLYAILQVDPGDEEAKCITGKPGDILEEVAPCEVILNKKDEEEAQRRNYSSRRRLSSEG